MRPIFRVIFLTGFGVAIRSDRFKIRPDKRDVRSLTELVDTRTTSGQVGEAPRLTAVDAGLSQSPALTSDLLTAVGVSASGIRAFGGDPAHILDPFFADGPAKDAISLGDEVDQEGRPLSWLFGDRDETTPDVLVIFGSGDLQTVNDGAQGLLNQLGDSIKVVYREEGRRLANDTEHFGFVDGISQPGFRGRIDATTFATPRSLPADNPLADQWARPCQPVTWPGQFIFGYAGLQPDAPFEPGPIIGADPILKNGSLLVLRRLSQDVDGFRNAMHAGRAAFPPHQQDMGGGNCIGTLCRALAGRHACYSVSRPPERRDKWRPVSTKRLSIFAADRGRDAERPRAGRGVSRRRRGSQRLALSFFWPCAQGQSARPSDRRWKRKHDAALSDASPRHSVRSRLAGPPDRSGTA
jgi:deferrochelatase/peroxidase EfeB